MMSMCLSHEQVIENATQIDQHQQGPAHWIGLKTVNSPSDLMVSSCVWGNIERGHEAVGL